MKLSCKSGMTFDYGNMFGDGRLQAELVNAAIDKYAVAANSAINNIRTAGIAKAHLSKDGSPEHVYFLRMPYVAENNPNTPASIAKLKAFTDEFHKVDAVVFLGIGGSYLGAKVLVDALGGLDWNRNTAKRNGMPRIYFSGNNLDHEDCAGILQELFAYRDYYQEKYGRAYKIMLVPISKSGTTMETMACFLHFYNQLSNADNVRLKGAVVTDLRADIEKSPLLQLADKFHWPKFDIKEGIGGRFSVMTDPGLLALVALGGDVDEFLRGAREMDEHCQQVAAKENPAFINALLKYLAYKEGKDMEVFMPYCMRLKALSEWYVQLLAESLGKRYDREGKIVNYGRTPVVAVGTTDMHAQTQQHQEGKLNKVVQFVEIAEDSGAAVLKNPFSDIPYFDKYDGLAMHSALKIALEANEKALTSDNRYNAKITLPKLNEYYLGQLMYFLMLTVAYEGELADVDAYDQPGVEVYKRFMREMLGE